MHSVCWGYAGWQSAMYHSRTAGEGDGKNRQQIPYKSLDSFFSFDTIKHILLPIKLLDFWLPPRLASRR